MLVESATSVTISYLAMAMTAHTRMINNQETSAQKKKMIMSSAKAEFMKDVDIYGRSLLSRLKRDEARRMCKGDNDMRY